MPLGAYVCVYVCVKKKKAKRGEKYEEGRTKTKHDFVEHRFS